MIPTRIGQKCSGGTFAGFYTEHGRVYSIIVAPKSAEVEIEVSAAQNYCNQLVIENYEDWDLPRYDETLIIFANIYRTILRTLSRSRLTHTIPSYRGVLSRKERVVVPFNFESAEGMETKWYYGITYGIMPRFYFGAKLRNDEDRVIIFSSPEFNDQRLRPVRREQII